MAGAQRVPLAFAPGSRAAGAALRDKALPVPHRILAATGLTSSEIAELQNLLDRATANLDGFNPLTTAQPNDRPTGAAHRCHVERRLGYR